MLTTHSHQRPAAPSLTCAAHREPLYGGPVQFWCESGHTVYAADISNEFVPPGEVGR